MDLKVEAAVRTTDGEAKVAVKVDVKVKLEAGVRAADCTAHVAVSV